MNNVLHVARAYTHLGVVWVWRFSPMPRGREAGPIPRCLLVDGVDPLGLWEAREGRREVTTDGSAGWL